MPRGFSLIELCIVVLILGLALTVTVANIGGIIPQEKLRGAATDIGNSLQFARSEAAATGANYAMVYDLDNHAYWLLVPRAASDRYERSRRSNDEDMRYRVFETRLPQGIEFKDIQFGEGAKRTSGEVQVEVTPLGTASGHVVHLLNTENDEEYTIELNPLTALVTYSFGYHEFEEVIDYD